MTYLSKKQIDLLLQPIHPKRVLERDGMSYVEAYDIRAELNRVFGFGRWSTTILTQDLLCETEVKTSKGKDAWYVAYKTSLLLEVRAPDGTRLCQYEESHVGDSTHPVRGEAHGNALTNSHSYALKRCAHNLGDQFGLSLYNKGSREKIVRWTLVKAEEDGRPETADTDDVPQVAEEQQQPAEADTPARFAHTDAEHERLVPGQSSEDRANGKKAERIKGKAPGDEFTVTDKEWYAGVEGEIRKFTSDDYGRVLWRRVNEKVEAGGCSPQDGEKLQTLIRARHKALEVEREEVPADA